MSVPSIELLILTTKDKIMLQDPNVERYVEQAMKPVLKQIEELKAEVKELKKALHKTDVARSTITVCRGCHSSPCQCKTGFY